MVDQVVKSENELTEQNKVVSLFHFIQQLNQLKQKAILNVKDHPWFFPVSKLHNDPENITPLQYRDRVETEDADISSSLLSVRKPKFKKCPEPAHVFREWLEPGWDNYKQEPHVKETLTFTEEKKPLLDLFGNNEKSEEEPEHFVDNEERVAIYKKWLIERESWVEKQRITEQTRNLFANLYRLYFELQKESETEEIIVANGMIFDRENKDIHHPVLTHRVKLS